MGKNFSYRSLSKGRFIYSSKYEPICLGILQKADLGKTSVLVWEAKLFAMQQNCQWTHRCRYADLGPIGILESHS